MSNENAGPADSSRDECRQSKLPPLFLAPPDTANFAALAWQGILLWGRGLPTG